MARVIIRGTSDYVISSEDTSSTSTTTGVVLGLDYDFPLKPRITDGEIGVGSEFRWPIFYATVTAASESALKTAVDALVAAILNCSGKSILYEETNGTTLYIMDAAVWPQALGDVETDLSDLTARVEFSFKGLRAGTIATGGADEPGQTGPITWDYEMSGGGLAGMVARAVFVNIPGGAGARENAIAWINKMRNPSNWSSEAPWLATSFRRVGVVVEMDQKTNESGVIESSFDPVRVTMTFRELHSTLAANANWPALLAPSSNWNVAMTARPPLNARSTQSPGYDLILFGDLILQTQGNTTFNTSETKLTDAEVYQTARTCVQCIVTHFTAIYGGLNLTQWGEPNINIDPVQGIVAFSVRFSAGTDILQWEEHCVIHNIPLKRRNRATDGSSWKYEQAGGPDRILRHSLRIVALSPQPYRAPSLSSEWDEDPSELEPTIELKDNNGTAEFHTYGAKQWVWMNSGPTGLQGHTATLTPKTLATIGDGLL